MWKTHWVILKCFLRSNFHKVQEQSACEMLSTSNRACEKSVKPNCLWDVSHSLATAPKRKHTKKHTVSEMRPPHERAAAIAHPQPLRSFKVQVQRKGAKPFPRQILETLTSSSTQLWNKYAPMPPLFRRCWIFPSHFQMFRTYFWTSRFFCLNPTSDMNDNPLKTA